jgi:hypothetical protein
MPTPEQKKEIRAKPAFVIYEGDRVIRIFSDGRVEGLKTDVRTSILNRIPLLIALAAEEAESAKEAISCVRCGTVLKGKVDG